MPQALPHRCVVRKLALRARAQELEETVLIQVTCGSVVKLQHAATGVNLHSHEISYGSGSGQQSVTGYTGGDDANDYWAVRGTEVCNLATNVPDSKSCMLPDASLHNSGL